MKTFHEPPSNPGTAAGKFKLSVIGSVNNVLGLPSEHLRENSTIKSAEGEGRSFV